MVFVPVYDGERFQGNWVIALVHFFINLVTHLEANEDCEGLANISKLFYTRGGMKTHMVQHIPKDPNRDVE
jgi:hypothetical protein